MRFKLTLSMILFMAVATVTAIFSIKATQEKKADSEISISAQEKLDQVEAKLASNEQEVERLKKNVSDNCLAKARAFSDMLALNPEKMNDTEWLNDIKTRLDCNELHVIDENGIITHSTVPEYIGFDMNSGEQSAAFMVIAEDPSIEIAQEPQVNAAAGIVIQYVGVTRKDAKGLVQVGVQPDVLAEALEGTEVDNVLTGFDFENGGFVFAIEAEDGEIHYFGPHEELVGKNASEIGIPVDTILDGKVNINGEEAFVTTKVIGEHVIGTYIPVASVYAQSAENVKNLSIVIALVNVAVLICINLYVSMTIVSGIKRIGAGVNEISKGNFEVSFSEKGNKEFRSLSDGLNHMTESIRSSSGKMRQASESLGNVAEDALSSFESIQKAVEEIAYNATRQAGDTQDVSHVAEVIGESINSTTDRTEELADRADKMITSTETANQAMNELHNISTEVEEVLTNVIVFATQTGDSAKEIASAIALIENIAKQTNLLSFNASVEAARAGEAGSGFAVLSKEIQTLAAQSSDASKQISDTIKRLIGDADKLSASMHTMERTMDRQRKQLVAAEDRVSEVIREAEESMEGIRNIEALVKEMDAAKNTLTTSVSSLADIAASNAAGSEETTAMLNETAGAFMGMRTFAVELKDAAR